MATAETGTILRHVRGLVTAEQAAGLSDPDLLGRFTGAGDQAAFAALVRRHGGMVLGVCRRVLGNHADADDAFQATFLVLARKAASITRQTSLPCWLYRVAYHTAAKARSLLARRRAREAKAGRADTTDPLAEVTGRELVGVLDEELGRLSERLRAPLVLCYLEGKTRDEAAHELGWSLGTFKRRLEQARLRLRERLARRGLSVPGTLLAAGLWSDGAAAAVPGPLAEAAVRAALVPSAAATAAAALARRTLREILVARLRLAAAVVLLVGGLAAGVVALAAPVSAPQAPAVDPGKKTEAKAPAPQPAAPAKKEVVVTGRVLDADGRPVKGARVGVLKPAGPDTERMVVLEQTHTGADGQYRLRAPRPTGQEVYPTMILARAPGHGAGFAPVPTGAKASADIRLPHEQVLRGRFIDLQGQPLAGVMVEVGFVAVKQGEKIVGVVQPAAPSPLWFEPAVTDAMGRFRLTGIGPGQEVGVTALDDRLKPERLRLWAGKPAGEEVTHALAPAQWVQGRVTYADTGKPVAGGEVKMRGASAVRTDKDGRFRLSPFRDGHGGFVVARAAPGEPYIGSIKWMQDPKATERRQTADLTVYPGVVVRGTVKEVSSGKPVAKAIVYYYPQQFDNPLNRPGAAVGPVFPVTSGPDGRFEIVVLPGPGHLVVKGPTPAYVPVAIGRSRLNENKPGGDRHYAHGYLRVEFKPGDSPRGVELTIRRGVPVSGKLVGPDGEAVTGARMLTRLSTSAPMVIEEVRGVAVLGGAFELPGCDPDKAYPVVFLDEKKGWGAVVEVSGKQAGEPLTVRMQPCGSAKVRFLDKDGKPLEGHWPEVEMVFTPGPHRYDFKAAQRGLTAADTVNLSNVYRDGYQLNNFRTDREGRATLPALVPGVTYRIVSLQQGGRTLREFTVRPGETVDLKDVRLGAN